ncbi:MAG TPA: DUF418 domain-containing protein [Sphingomicrobium sp.]|nr:DUF418 domain-containing protein [Sphingomicrobium sp.]
MIDAAHAAGGRLTSLDVVRGIAVMGILLANLPAFGLPEPAYFSPLAWGGTAPADITAWFLNFVLVEGRMRGLFSLLFGASMLLIVERARDRHESGAAAHFRRMAVLFAIGLAHLYLVWWGDILAHYALVGAFAFLFTRAATPTLVLWGLIFLTFSAAVGLGGYMTMLASAARDTPEAAATWASFAQGFGVPPRADIVAEIAAMKGSWLDQLRWRWENALDPFRFLKIGGLQTLATMLLGMAAFRSGLLTGSWERRRLARWAAVCLLVSWTAYALLGLSTMRSGFDQRAVFLASIVASEPFRVIGAIGYAALMVLLARRGGWLTARIAAVGRAAFSNYLGTSLLVTFIFYGWGLGMFGELGRAQLYLLAPLVWALMLLWSKPWLDRFAYGPLEWAWRSLSRGRFQPMRRLEPKRA